MVLNVEITSSEYPDLVSWILRWWRVISLCAFVGLAGSLIYALIASVRYRAEVVCAVAQTRSTKDSSIGALAGRLGALGGLAGITAGGSPEREEIIAELRSRVFLSRFIAERNLAPLLFRNDWDSKNKRWKEDFWSRPHSQLEAAKFFDERVLRIAAGDKSSLLRIQIEWGDSNVAADLANQLVLELNRDLSHKAREDAERRMIFLRTYLARTTEVDVRSALNSQMAEELQQLATASVTPEFALRVIQPAYAPDSRDYVWPKRVLIVALGLIGGLALGLAVATAVTALPREPTRTRTA
jgi:uncharacterized protein involved in exopolysaccharide biosynthesis